MIKFYELSDLDFHPEWLIVASDAESVFLANVKGYKVFGLSGDSAPSSFVKLEEIDAGQLYSRKGEFCFCNPEARYFLDVTNFTAPPKICKSLEGGSFEGDVDILKGVNISDSAGYLEDIGDIGGESAFMGFVYNYVLSDGAFVQGDVAWPDKFEVRYIDEERGRALVRARFKKDYTYAICNFDRDKKAFLVDDLIPFKTSLNLYLTREDGPHWRHFNEEIFVFSEKGGDKTILNVEVYDWEGRVLQERTNMYDFVDLPTKSILGRDCWVFGKKLLFAVGFRGESDEYLLMFFCWDPALKEVIWESERFCGSVSRIDRDWKYGGHVAICLKDSDGGFRLVMLEVSSGDKILDIPVRSQDKFVSNGFLFCYPKGAEGKAISYVDISEIMAAS